MNCYYFTFGTSSTFPFQKGWVEVHAENRSAANELFRCYFPDIHENTLNCSSIYDQAGFQKYRTSLTAHPDWNICHGTISEDGFVPNQDDMSYNAASSLNKMVSTAQMQAKAGTSKERDLSCCNKEVPR